MRALKLPRKLKKGLKKAELKPTKGIWDTKNLKIVEIDSVSIVASRRKHQLKKAFKNKFVSAYHLG